MRMKSTESSVSELKQLIRNPRGDLLTHQVVAIVAAYHGQNDEGGIASIEMPNQSGKLVSREKAALFLAALWQMFESLHDTLAPQGYEINEGGGGEFRAECSDRGSHPHLL